ncbi:PGDYG domain-containing protein [Weissella viridescens]|uniref:PGDYG domain-containing protein n=1 Tax=Weissella viridescens TaxID=1629 RepID=UPI001C7D4ED2|nr:PGDYG domain-containing protein [Weissella viridescens]MBX4172574.1 PGDYG domain-containing protein [Weissella viridescens]
MRVYEKTVELNAWQLPDIDDNDFDVTLNKLAKLLPLVPYSRVRVLFTINRYVVTTLQGATLARSGDYIVQGSNDDVWVIHREIFEDTYEVIDDDSN